MWNCSKDEVLLPHDPRLPRCFYPDFSLFLFNQSWATRFVVFINSVTMLVSAVCHFNGKKKNCIPIVPAYQGCLAALLRLPNIPKVNMC